MALELVLLVFVFFFKQKTAYEITYGDWSSDVCSSDLAPPEDGSVCLKPRGIACASTRSEEHTSELQSPYVISYAVFCLKKNNTLLTQTLRFSSGSTASARPRYPTP